VLWWCCEESSTFILLLLLLKHNRTSWRTINQSIIYLRQTTWVHRNIGKPSVLSKFIVLMSRDVCVFKKLGWCLLQTGQWKFWRRRQLALVSGKLLLRVDDIWCSVSNGTTASVLSSCTRLSTDIGNAKNETHTSSSL